MKLLISIAIGNLLSSHLKATKYILKFVKIPASCWNKYFYLFISQMPFPLTRPPPQVVAIAKMSLASPVQALSSSTPNQQQ